MYKEVKYRFFKSHNFQINSNEILNTGSKDIV